MSARTDAAQNLGELQAFNTKKGVGLRGYEVKVIDRRWRSLGKLARQPGGLFSVKHYN